MLKNYKNTVIAIMLACILTMAVGYSILSQRLNISGTSNIATNFSVKITNITSVATGKASNKEVPTFDDATATFSANLVNPGDKMTYNITVSNLGNINAILEKINMTTSNNPAILFSYSGITEGEVLKAGDTTELQVVVEYLSSITSQPESITSDLIITLDYKDNFSNTSDDPIVEENNYLAHRTLESTYWFDERITNNLVESITFTTTNEVPSDAGNNFFDVSELQNGSIMAWYYDNNSNGLYEIIVGQNGGVIANPDSSHLFNKLSNVTSIDLTNLDTSNVVNMRSMFNSCAALEELDVTPLDTSSVTDMLGMFGACSSLKALDVSGFKTGLVTTMRSMFGGCSSLTELDLSSWDVSQVQNMYSIFYSCTLLKTINLDNWNTASLTNTAGMFGGCSSLESLDLRHFNTSNVTNMASTFAGCPSLKTLNISTWDTSKVTSMYSMFYKSSGIEVLDLSSFNTSKVENMDGMFGVCSSLKTIYASELWNNESITSAIDMFAEDKLLVGSMSYDWTKITQEYANYTTGYFTYKAAPSA